ncbi:hypothetical protein CEXT_699871 [Caerostris extrusa]|uniref:Uncharacterized protein n=1 Tax=Caerostris extrusa TaxID=172846 RepID=A0AAV4W3I3_CAEEX|nr:hypothetical protein CEXT_699871 [Caerostris extrusa]
MFHRSDPPLPHRRCAPTSLGKASPIICDASPLKDQGGQCHRRKSRNPIEREIIIPGSEKEDFPFRRGDIPGNEKFSKRSRSPSGEEDSVGLEKRKMISQIECRFSSHKVQLFSLGDLETDTLEEIAHFLPV